MIAVQTRAITELVLIHRIDSGNLHAQVFEKGGIVGNLISGIFVRFFDFYGGLAIMIALFAISLLIIFEAKLSLDSFMFWRRSREEDEEYENDETGEYKIQLE